MPHEVITYLIRGGVKIKHIPNIISVIRIFISVCLIYASSSAQFVIYYLLCGFSDILDGYIARRYKLETKLGEKLDSFADFIFWAVILYFVLFHTDIYAISFIIGIGIIFILRVINLLITKIKFGQWGMLHSWGNKLTGILLYILLPICIVSGKILQPIAVLLFSVAMLSSIDEMAILLSAQQYNANRKNYFLPE